MMRRTFLGKVAITAASAGVLTIRGTEVAHADPLTLSVDPASGEVPFDVTATVANDGATAEARYLFAWGDGTSTGPQASNVATHTYTEAGDYEVSVGVTDTVGALIQALPGNIITGDFPGGFSVPAGEMREIVGLVTTAANVIVEGTLKMRPGSTLRFVNVDESAFVGGGMDPVASDVGLWVVGAGRLDLQGTPRVGWNRTGDDPTWIATDELRVAPTAVGDYGSAGFASFTKGGAVPKARPDVPPAEVFNLTRDVNIEGTPGGRSHVFIRNTEPVLHTIDYVGFRHLGPRKDGKTVLGRWGLHFHHSMHNNHGQVVRGCVARDQGAHSFVAHASHGVTFTDCVAYDVVESPYWWDLDVLGDKTDGITYDHCFAGFAQPGDDKQDVHGFVLAAGEDNTLADCAAAGIQAFGAASGLNWPEKGGPGTKRWVVDGITTHNNKSKGAFFWSNAVMPTQTTRNLTAYRNGGTGVQAGAYRFSMDWENPVVAENGSAGFRHSAIGPVLNPDNPVDPDGNAFHGLVARGEVVGLLLGHSPAAGAEGIHERFYDARIEDCTTPIRVEVLTSVRGYDLIRPQVDGRDLLPSDVQLVSAGVGSVMRVQRLDNLSAWQMDLNTGQVTEIPPFA